MYKIHSGFAAVGNYYHRSIVWALVLLSANLLFLHCNQPSLMLHSAILGADRLKRHDARLSDSETW